MSPLSFKLVWFWHFAQIKFICDCLALTLTPWFHSVVARGTTQCVQRLCDNTPDWHLTTQPPTMWLSFPPHAKCSWGGSCALRAFGENPINKKRIVCAQRLTCFCFWPKRRSLCHGCLASKKITSQFAEALVSNRTKIFQINEDRILERIWRICRHISEKSRGISGNLGQSRGNSGKLGESREKIGETRGKLGGNSGELSGNFVGARKALSRASFSSGRFCRRVGLLLKQNFQKCLKVAFLFFLLGAWNHWRGGFLQGKGAVPGSVGAKRQQQKPKKHRDEQKKTKKQMTQWKLQTYKSNGWNLRIYLARLTCRQKHKRKQWHTLLACNLQTNGITANVSGVTLIVPVFHGQTKKYATTNNRRAKLTHPNYGWDQMNPQNQFHNILEEPQWKMFCPGLFKPQTDLTRNYLAEKQKMLSKCRRPAWMSCRRGVWSLVWARLKGRSLSRAMMVLAWAVLQSLLARLSWLCNASDDTFPKIISKLSSQIQIQKYTYKSQNTKAKWNLSFPLQSWLCRRLHQGSRSGFRVANTWPDKKLRERCRVLVDIGAMCVLRRLNRLGSTSGNSQCASWLSYWCSALQDGC